MNITVCLHRAATVEEINGLPAEWHGNIGGMAGGPVACLWSRGIPDAPSCLPCAKPIRLPTSEDRPDLWIPEDCGQCPPCKARAALRMTAEIVLPSNQGGGDAEAS